MNFQEYNGHRVDKEKMRSEILRVLKEASHPIQIEEIQADLREFQGTPIDIWNSVLGDLISDSLIEGNIIRSGIFGIIGASIQHHLHYSEGTHA